MSDIKIFENEEFGQIRTLADEQGEPLFVAKDVCEAFGVTNRNRTMRGSHLRCRQAHRV